MTEDAQNKESAPITQLLQEWGDGDANALNKVLPMVYDELRKLARSQFSGEKNSHPLQTTELVNLVYLRLLEGKNQSFRDRQHFFWYASQMIRFILVDYARRHLSQKRGGGQITSLDSDVQEPSTVQGLDIPNILTMDKALKELEGSNSRQARIVEMRFFAGMNHHEIADALDLAVSTVKRDWGEAKRKLYLIINRDKQA